MKSRRVYVNLELIVNQKFYLFLVVRNISLFQKVKIIYDLML